MQTYVVHVYRDRPEDKETISGVIEDIESGQKEYFNSFISLQSKLVHSIGRGQLELTGLVSEGVTAFDTVAMSR